MGFFLTNNYMYLIIVGLIICILISIFARNNKRENFNDIENCSACANLSKPTLNYYSGYRAPLPQPDINKRKMFDSLTYDFPYLKLI
jgi:hypothetical protein